STTNPPNSTTPGSCSGHSREPPSSSSKSSSSSIPCEASSSSSSSSPHSLEGSSPTPPRGTNELQSVLSVFGLEYAECITWRQGSLLYAFCNTKLNNDPVWMLDNQVTFLNYLYEGIRYLQALWSARNFNPVKQQQKEGSSNDVQQGENEEYE